MIKVDRKKTWYSSAWELECSIESGSLFYTEKWSWTFSFDAIYCVKTWHTFVSWSEERLKIRLFKLDKKRNFIYNFLTNLNWEKKDRKKKLEGAPNIALILITSEKSCVRLHFRDSWAIFGVPLETPLNYHLSDVFKFKFRIEASCLEHSLPFPGVNHAHTILFKQRHTWTLSRVVGGSTMSI